MTTVLDKVSTFLRCHNSLEIPESVCTQCFHTLVARDLQALEQAEIVHRCSSWNHGRTSDD